MKTRFKRSLKSRVSVVKSEYTQFKVLVRHFVLRLFNNDIMTFENQRGESLVIMAAFLVVTGGMTAFWLLWPYLEGALGYTSENVWIEKTFFMTLSMAFTGIISVINWDNMFLDKKDYAHLTSLPVKAETVFTAKFVGLLVFIGMLSLALNVVPFLIFGFSLDGIINVNPYHHTSLLGLAGIHMLASFMANLSVFLLVALIQGIFLIMLSREGFKKISVMLQSLLLMGFMSVFIWFPHLAPSMEGFRETYNSFIYYFPPLWFVGFYEQLIGNTDIVFKDQMIVAALVVTVLVDLYLLCIPLAYKRFAREAPANGNHRHIPAIWKGLRKGFGHVLLPQPIQRAMYYFALAGIQRSRRHKLQLSAAIALPVSFIITEMILIAITRGEDTLHQILPLTASIPFVIIVFMVTGFRTMVNLPVMEEANWIFHMVGQYKSPHYLRGVLKVFYVFGIVPISLLFLGIYMYLWAWPAALTHTLFSTVTACIALEAAFFNYNRLPFVSTYIPGKARLKDFWFLYLAGFALFIVGFTYLSLECLKQPLYYLLFLIMALDVFLAIKFYRKRNITPLELVLEEEPEPAMMGLGLD